MYLPLKHPIWPFETIDFKMAAVLPKRPIDGLLA